MCKFTLFGYYCRCNFADVMPRKLFWLESAQSNSGRCNLHRYKARVFLVVGPSRRRGGWVVASALSPTQPYFSCLSSQVIFLLFLCFCRISLSKPVIVVDEHASYMRTRMTLRLMASHTGRPLNPSILGGNSFPCFQDEKSWWNMKKKKKEKGVNDRETVTKRNARARAPKNTLVDSLFVPERETGRRFYRDCFYNDATLRIGCIRRRK